MRFPTNVRFRSNTVEFEEIQIQPIVAAEILDEEPEIPILELTEDELNEQLQESYQNGLKDGSDQYKEEYEVQYQDQLEQLQTLVSKFEVSQEQFFDKAQHYIIDIACKLSENIIHKTLNENPEYIIEMVTESLKRLRESNTIKIIVSTVDYELLNTLNFNDLINVSSDLPIKLVVQDELSRGSYLIESDAGNLYSIIEDQIEKIKQDGI